MLGLTSGSLLPVHYSWSSYFFLVNLEIIAQGRSRSVTHLTYSSTHVPFFPPKYQFSVFENE